MTIEIIDHTKPGDGMSEERARELLETPGTVFDTSAAGGCTWRVLPSLGVLCETSGRVGCSDPEVWLKAWREGDLTFRRAVLHLHPFEEGER